MKNVNICTWIYCESKGEESKYAQMAGKSSDPKFQAIYWRCIVLYFASSIRNNPDANHLLFTNVSHVPNIGKLNTEYFLNYLGVKLITIPFTYQTPVGYFGAWRNQFYIFDILKYLSNTASEDDIYMILDSDCVWVNSNQRIVEQVTKHGLLTYEPIQPFNEMINGLTRLDMKQIYEELDHQRLEEAPKYFGGEFFAATGKEIKKVFDEFSCLWLVLLQRFQNDQPKFNEEAHTLSYIYHKLGYASRTANPYFRRIWTSHLIYDSVPKDFELDVWHLPSEKMYGIKRLFWQACNPRSNFWTLPTGQPFVQYAAGYLGITKPSFSKRTLDVIERKMPASYLFKSFKRQIRL